MADITLSGVSQMHTGCQLQLCLPLTLPMGIAWLYARGTHSTDEKVVVECNFCSMACLALAYLRRLAARHYCVCTKFNPCMGARGGS